MALLGNKTGGKRDYVAEWATRALVYGLAPRASHASYLKGTATNSGDLLPQCAPRTARRTFDYYASARSDDRTKPIGRTANRGWTWPMGFGQRGPTSSLKEHSRNFLTAS